MRWLGRFGWIGSVIATVGIAAGIFLIRLPTPKASIVIDHITVTSGSGQRTVLALPHVLFPTSSRQTGAVHYRAHFTLPERPRPGLFLLIPSLNRPISILLNGQPLFASVPQLLWEGPLMGSSVFVQLPPALLVRGRNELTGTAETGLFIVPAYLPKIFIGSAAVLGPVFRLRVLLDQRLKLMALAANVLLGLGVIFAYFCRPRDPLFRWLAGTISVNLLLSIVFFAGFRPGLQALLPYATALVPLQGFLVLGVAFVLAGIARPRGLKIAAIAVSVLSLVLLPVSPDPVKRGLALTEVGLLIAAFIAATSVVAWGARQRGNIDARFMLSPFFLVCCSLIRDTAATAGLYDRPILITPYARALAFAAVVFVLMRRFAVTLNALDQANDTLNFRLAAREAELAELYRVERAEAARLVREEERRRLTRDLHDGIGGHLTSIIAMTAGSTAALEPVERTARQALEDLRLVIYSLDLCDGELPVALASFRERLVPQLQRLNVMLEWSMADFPEVSGVTPGNALTILRILQEAITNAIKHGPARRVSVHAEERPGGCVAIVVENDGRPFTPGRGGLGLKNMCRRACQLHGRIQIHSLDHGVRAVLLVPSRLPDIGVENDDQPQEFHSKSGRIP